MEASWFGMREKGKTYFRKNSPFANFSAPPCLIVVFQLAAQRMGAGAPLESRQYCHVAIQRYLVPKLYKIRSQEITMKRYGDTTER
jgi:hypothetical protein